MEAFGVEIIEKTEITTPEWTVWSYVVVAAIILAVVIYIFRDDAESFITGLLSILLGAIIISFTVKDVPTGRYQYEVFVDSPEDVKYLYLNYDVIETGNYVYIVEDKEETNP